MDKRKRKLDQSMAPIHEALEDLKRKRIVPFDVPGHKRGKGNKALTDFLGAQCLSVDVNSMKYVDNLCHPTSVIKDAEILAAEAFGAKHAYFMVNGTSSAIQAMILACCKKDDKIILPRNVHRSIINSLVISGAVPVYVNPHTSQTLGIALGMSVSEFEKAVKENPDAKAVLVNNPTYYGICSNLKEITRIAHEHKMLVLVDEAHGTHFYFGDNLPISAMAADADMAAVSMHKSGGSLTQSSFLLIGKRVNPAHMRKIINLTQTTSASYLLLSSLDISRKNLALNGKEIFAGVIEMTDYIRDEINEIGDYYAYSKELINGDTVFDFDTTKLPVNTLNTGLAGIEVFDLLRDEYDIQVEFGDIGNILAYVSVGDRISDAERLVSALYEIRRRYKRDKTGMLTYEYISPRVVLPPQTAFHADKVSVDLSQSLGRVCAEFVMCYPPGIPILAPGEEITAPIVEYIEYTKDKGCLLIGAEDIEHHRINVLK